MKKTNLQNRLTATQYNLLYGLLAHIVLSENKNSTDWDDGIYIIENKGETHEINLNSIIAVIENPTQLKFYKDEFLKMLHSHSY